MNRYMKQLCEQFLCPNCGRTIGKRKDLRGQRWIKCPYCGEDILNDDLNSNEEIASDATVGQTHCVSNRKCNQTALDAELQKELQAIRLSKNSTSRTYFDKSSDYSQNKSSIFAWMIGSVLFAAVIIFCFVMYSCSNKRNQTLSIPSPSTTPSTPASTSTPAAQKERYKISESDVIRQTRIALDMAQQTSGARMTGFSVDHCVIGETKAVCHFHCYVNGVRHVGGIEFDIENGKLIPSGQYYLDADI